MADETTSPSLSDEQVDNTLSIIQAITAYREEAEEARRDRLRMSARNREAVANKQDFAHKQEGQSTEFLPKSSAAVQQWKAFIKRGITQFGDWFEMEMAEDSPLTGTEARGILMEYLDELPCSLFNNDVTNIGTLLSDGSEVAMVEAYAVFKVHGYKRTRRGIKFERGGGKAKDIKPWNLAIDLVKNESIYLDPTGRGLYKIHRVERDLIDVKRLAEQGVYDKEVVDRIVADNKRKEEEVMARKRDLKQDQTPPPSFRKRVVIDEFWGTIIDSDNNIVHENIVATVANDTYLIRKPTPNPFWHQSDPFIIMPLIRVPFSVHHKALADDFVPLNEAQNELFNLMLDGSLASVWGISQVRPAYLEDPRQVSSGIAQGTTLVMNDSAPPDAKVFEQVSTGQLPPDAMNMFSVLGGEFNGAALTNEIRLGQLPSKQVKATEVVEASQSQAVLLDSIIADTEFHISLMLKKAWLTVLQNADDLEIKAIDGAVGRQGALILARMSPKERYESMGSLSYFKVKGLSAMLTKARDFEKFMGIIQAVQGNPILLQAFFKKHSPERIIDQLFKQMNMNPKTTERSEEEMAQMAAEAQDATTMQQQGLGGQGTQSGLGGAATESAINQEIQPTAGT
jgi:hypothetical protein